MLAGKANNPGSFSRKTVNVLAYIDANDAKIFANLCNYVWVIDGHWQVPLFLDTNYKIYTNNSINEEIISHLEILGLVYLESPYGIGVRQSPQPQLSEKAIASYHNRQIQLEIGDIGQINGGFVEFTKSGIEPATICKFTPVDAFFEYIYETWYQGKDVSPVILNWQQPSAAENHQKSRPNCVRNQRRNAQCGMCPPKFNIRPTGH